MRATMQRALDGVDDNTHVHLSLDLVESLFGTSTLLRLHANAID